MFLVVFQKGSPLGKTKNPDFYLNSPLSDHARELYQQGNFLRAEQHYQHLAKEYLLSGDIPLAISSFNNAAGCLLATYSYKKAAETYLQARALAQKIHHSYLNQIIDANLALIYGLMGDHRKTIEIGEAILSQPDPDQLISGSLYLYLGNAYHQLHQPEKSHQFFIKAADRAEQSGDAISQAMALDHLGLSYLDRNQPDFAQPYIHEAFRIRKLRAQDDLFLSYRSMGKLESLLNQNEQAERSLSRAIDYLREHPGRTPLHDIYAERAKVREQLDDSRGASRDYRSAFNSFRSNRSDFYTTGELSATAETTHEKLRASFASFAYRQYAHTRDPSIAVESLIAIEESRFISLLRQRSELQAFGSSSGQGIEESAPQFQRTAARHGKESIENFTLNSHAISQLVLQRVQTVPTNEAVFSFYLSYPNSYVWVVTSESILLQKLPSKEIIQDHVIRFRNQIRENDPDVDLIAEKTYSILFQGLPDYVRTKKLWTIIPDDSLFDLPFAALQPGSTESSDSHARYLGQQYLLRKKTGILSISFPTARSSNPSFIGLGDAIYNLADTRLSARSTPTSKSTHLELPRLFNSGEEVRKSASVWGQSSTIHTGAAVTSKVLLQSKLEPSSILHIAAHLIPSQKDESRMLISLGYDIKTGRPQIIDDTHISSTYRDLNLVVLSGCHSGNGNKLPGVGLLGLTRSWLVSGATQVLATYWPIPDDTENFFVRFYTHYQHALRQNINHPADHALRLTQVEMVSSNDWRSAMQFWSSFFILSGS